MSRLATMGASSCATIAVSGFRPVDKKLNEEWNADPASFKEGEGLTVSEWYEEVLYPTTQPLGQTKEYPFDLLMERISDYGFLDTKFTIAVLNSEQYHNGYWPSIFEKHGFELVDKTKNTIGSVNYIYTRNNNRVE